MIRLCKTCGQPLPQGEVVQYRDTATVLFVPTLVPAGADIAPYIRAARGACATHIVWNSRVEPLGAFSEIHT